MNKKHLAGTFGPHPFKISNIVLQPKTPTDGVNPSICFDLKTPFGLEHIDTELQDGCVIHYEGSWSTRCPAMPNWR
ncbi:MAG: hypothetical protein ABI216_15745, partial [Devosia sp.]